MADVTNHADENPIYITPENLCKRWDGAVTVKTLANWRSLGKGPDWTCLTFNRVLYYRDSVDAFEESRKRLRGSRGTGGKGPSLPADETV